MLLKRSLSLSLCALLALSLCVFSLPRTAKAAPTGVWVGGIELADGAYYLNDGAGGITAAGASSGNYNVRYDSGTLYLKDALITKNISWEDISYNRTAAVYTSGSLRIMLEGRSQLCGADITGSFPASFGVRCTGDLFIQGGGSLTAIGGMATYSYGLNCTETLTFGGSGSVIATGGTATGTSYGVLGARITVSDGTLTATGGTATSSSYGVYSGGINPGPITVSGGTLIATGGTATYKSYGVFGNNGVHIASGLTVARSGVAQDAAQSQAINVTPSGLAPLTGGPSETFAVYGDASTYAVIDKTKPIRLENDTPVNWLDYTGTYKPVDSSGHFEWDSSTLTLTLTNVIINTAQVNAVKLPAGATLTFHGASVVKGYSTESNHESSYGIYGMEMGGLTLNGDGSIIAIGGTVTTNVDSYGVRAGALTLNSGSLTAIGGTTTYAGKCSYGIYSSGVTLAGGNLTAIGGTSSNISYGVGGNSVTVSSGTLTAIGGTSSNISYGVYGYPNVTVRGGTITAAGGTAGGISVGIISMNRFTVENGAVRALGGTASSSQGVWSINVTVSNGTVTAAGGTAPLSAGVRGDQNSRVTLSGGTITASGNSSALYDVTLGFGTAPTWYMWKTDPALTYTKSSDIPYNRNPLDDLYLKVTPAMDAPVITTTALSDGVVGANYTKTLEATGGSITWSVTAGALPARLSLDPATGLISGTPTAAGTYTFTVKATNKAGSDTQELILAVSDAPVPPVAPAITTQPAPQRITMGNAATFTAAASGNPAPTYQWQVSSDDGATWRNVPGATTSSYTTPETTASMNGYQYRCVATNSAGSATSSAAALTVYVPAPNVDVVPASLSFGSFPAGSAPLAQVVTVTNRDGNTMGLELPQDNDLIITAVEGFIGNHALIPSGGSAKFSVQPKSTLPIGSYSNTIRLVFRNSTVFDIPVFFTVTPASGGDSSSMAGGGAYTGNQYPGSFSSGASGGPVLTVQAPCEKCISVIVDNVQLKENADYIKECGSTIITFTPSYLATLKDGAHSIRVQFTDGRYDGNFVTPFTASLAAAPMADVPATGDVPILARLIEWLLPHAAMRNA